MKMDTYKVELNKQFVQVQTFLNKESDDLRCLRDYLNQLFEDKHIEKQN